MWGIVLGVLGVFVAGAVALVSLNRSDFAIGLTDIRKVTADPALYAGATLKSSAIIDTPGFFRGVGAMDADPLRLMMSQELNAKAVSIWRSVGRHGAIIIKYRIHDQATFARIDADKKAEVSASAEDERIMRDAQTAQDVSVQKADNGEEIRRNTMSKAVDEENEIMRQAGWRTDPSLNRRVPDKESYTEAEEKVRKMREVREKAERQSMAEEERIRRTAQDGYSKAEERVRKRQADRQRAWNSANGGDDPSKYNGILLDIWIP
jgi:hypothetical protein